MISYNLDATPGYEFFRVLDRSRDALGRDTCFQLKTASTIVETQENGVRVQILTKSAAFLAFQHATKPAS